MAAIGILALFLIETTNVPGPSPAGTTSEIIVETRLEQLHVETLVVVSVMVFVRVVVWVTD